MIKFSKKLMSLIAVLVVLLSGTAFFLTQFPEYAPSWLTWSSLERHKEPSDFSRAETFSQTLELVNKYYYDRSNINPRQMLRAAMLALGKSASEILVRFPEEGSHFTIQVADQEKTFRIPLLKNLMDLLPVIQKAFGFIEDHYTGEVELNNLEYAAINGALENLDPHSTLLTPKFFSEFKTQTEGEFGGLGIVIGMRDGDLMIIAPLPDTPAWTAGLKPKDKIIKIGDQATINMSLNEAVELMRGKIGTKVSLTVIRDPNPEPMTVQLTRAVIKIVSVQAKLLEDSKGEVAYIKIKNFQEETKAEVKNKLKNLRASAKNFKGVILDLRNNPGGLLNQAIHISDLFLERGTIVLTVGADDKIKEVDEARAFGTEPPYPMVVLVNQKSASASEIVAGALKNNNRAIILGENTFGKGSVQSVYTLKDGSALKLTIAQYLTPGNESIQSVGIIPDISLTPAYVTPEKIKMLPEESFKEKDLEKHLSSTHNKNNQSTYAITHFIDPPPDPELEDDEVEEYSDNINLEKDFPVILAQQIILQASQVERPALIEASKSLIETLSQTEETKIGEQLAKIGIDWSEGTLAGNPSANVTYQIYDSQHKPINAMLAGTESYLELKIKNVGAGQFYHLIAKTESENYLFKNKEFVFGNLKPNEEKSWTVKIKMPEAMLNREDIVTFKFTEDNQKAPEPFEIVVPLQALPQPRFAFSYELFDDGSYDSRGNGDKNIDPGEIITLKLQVYNQGSGPSLETSSNLKNTEGEKIFLIKGRDKLGRLDVAQSKEALLRFQVAKDYSKDQLKLEFVLSDNKLLETLGRTLTFPINKSSLDLPMSTKIQPPTLSLDSNPLSPRTDKKKLTLKGKAQDDISIKEISVYLGEEKVYLKYFKDPKLGGKSQNFNTDIELAKDKNHLVTIVATDHQDFSTKESFYVLRH